MCPPGGQATAAAEAPKTLESDDSSKDFPWHIGACDAHCHPTDTMASIASLSTMKARVLTIMATRSQDQDLVASVAAQQGIQDRSALGASGLNDEENDSHCQGVVPAFGWHPWFSHQLYDDVDTTDAAAATFDRSEPAEAQKARHYAAVLSPAPKPDIVSGLPEPQPLSEYIEATRTRLLTTPTALVGEIGLDKAFRLPWPWSEGERPSDGSDGDQGLTPGGREGRMLSPHHVKMAHQVRVLKAQLRLAGELGRPVSVHGVQAHGVLFEALASLWKGHEKEVVSRRKQRLVAKGAEDFSSSDDSDGEEHGYSEGGSSSGAPTGRRERRYEPKPFPPRICLHSFSGPPQMVQQYLNPAIPAGIYFSFSTVVNLSTAAGESKFPDVVKACPDDRLLVESDLHVAGDDMDRELEGIYRKVCQIKGWSLEDGLQRIRRNYEQFIFG